MNHINDLDLAIEKYDKNAINEIAPIPNFLMDIVLIYLSEYQQNRLGNAFKSVRQIIQYNLTNELKICNTWIGYIRIKLSTHALENNQRLTQLTEIETENQLMLTDIPDIRKRIINFKERFATVFNDNLENNQELLEGAPNFARNCFAIVNFYKQFQESKDLVKKYELIKQALALDEPQAALALFRERPSSESLNDQGKWAFIRSTNLLVSYLLRRDEIEEACKVYELALLIHPYGYSKTACIFANYIFTLQDPNEYNKVIDLLAKNLESFEHDKSSIARCIIDRLLLQEANVKAFEVLCRFDLQKDWMRTRIVESFITIGNLSKALEVANLDSEMGFDPCKVAKAYLEKGEFIEAEKIIQTIKDKNNSKFGSIEKLIMTCIALGKEQEALDYAQKYSHLTHQGHSLKEIAEQEISLRNLEKYLTEGKAEKAQKAYSQLKIAQKIPLLADLENCSEVRFPSTMIRITNDFTLFRILFGVNKEKALKFTLDSGKYISSRLREIKFLIEKKYLSEAESLVKSLCEHFNENRPKISNYEQGIELMVNSLIKLGDASNALRLAKDFPKEINPISLELQKNKYFFKIVCLFIAQNQYEQAKEVATEIPCKATRKWALKKIEDSQDKKNQVLDESIFTSQNTPETIVKDKDIEQPAEAPKNKFSTIFSTGFKWLAKKIVNFVKLVFSLIQTIMSLICTIPFYGIKKLSSRLYPQRV